MSGIDVIKSYLVELGFSADITSYNTVKSKLDDLTKVVENHTSDIASNYVRAGGTVVGVLAGITAATVEMINKVAQADLGYQKFALRMYMANDAAKQFKITTEAMGEDINNIAWLPELQQRYFKLMQEAKGMETPGEAKDNLRQVRDARFEMTRLKVEGTYAFQWIAYHLTKLNAGPGKDFIGWMADINNKIQLNMPMWTAKVAEFLQVFIRGGQEVIRVAQNVVEGLVALFNSFDNVGKGIIILAGIITAYIVMGPIGKAIIAFSALLIVLDEFYAYIDGRKDTGVLNPIFNVMIAAVDTLVRLFVTGAVAADRFYNTINRTKSAGQLRGLSVVDEIKEVWNAIPGVLGEGGFLEKHKAEQKAKGSGLGKEMEVAESISRQTGLPANIIYGQMWHETGGFTNSGAKDLHNYGGVKIPGTDEYRDFAMDDNYAKYFSNLIKRRYPKALTAKTPEDFAQALKDGGYYADSVSNYSAGITAGMGHMPGGNTGLPFASSTPQPQQSSNVEINF
jgi:tetrahydromethanopterin S-methyltransferase subunit G